MLVLNVSLLFLFKTHIGPAGCYWDASSHIYAPLFIHHLLINTSTPIDELVICFLNVRGLSNTLKRRETFRWHRMKKFSIFFLQEVHCTKEKEPLWFTWRRKKPEIQCRIAFFLTSTSLNPAVMKADILARYKTDHSLITLHLANNNNPSGPGFWKLNTSFLSDSEYVNVIKKTIAEVANEYNNNNEVDPVLLSDTIKMRIC